MLLHFLKCGLKNVPEIVIGKKQKKKVQNPKTPNFHSFLRTTF
jgi:hypothetical protein